MKKKHFEQNDMDKWKIKTSRALYTLLGVCFCVAPFVFVPFFFPNPTSEVIIWGFAIGAVLIAIGIFGPRWFHLYFEGP